MKEKAEEALTEFQNCPYGMFWLVRGLKADSIEVEGVRCMRGGDGKLYFSVDSFYVWKDYVERITNEENDLDCIVEGDAVESPVVFVSRLELFQALGEVKTGKATGPSEVSLEMIVTSGVVGVQVMAEICQRVLDGFGIPVEWAISIVVQIFEGKDDIRNCICY